MDWGSIGTQIILGIASALITAIGAFITYLINKYVKDEKLKNMLTGLNDLVTNVVLYFKQTYVDALKKEGKFDLVAQKNALEQALDKVKKTMPKEMWDWLVANYKDPDGYIKSLIEAKVGFLK